MGEELGLLRGHAVALAILALALPLGAQLPPELREELEIREIPVLVELPGSLAGETPRALRDRLVVLEDGVARAVTAVAPLAPPAGGGFARIVVGLDSLHCESAATEAALDALGRSASALASLGPLGSVTLGRGPVLEPAAVSRAEGLPDALARLAAGAACPQEPEIGAPSVEGLACPAPPCLLVWVGGGWRMEEGTAARSLGQADALARWLASGGWTVLALAPGSPAEPGPERPRGESRPGDDRTSWTVTLLGSGGGGGSGRVGEAPESAVDLSLAPLRRLVAGTGGEWVEGTEALDGALAELAARSLLYYRTDREPNAEPASIRVLSTGEPPLELGAPEWAPAGAAPAGEGSER